MTDSLRVLSLYEGFFSGGARILHSDVVRGLQAMGQEHTVLSIHSEVFREDTVQPMENDACYQELTAKGVLIGTLGRRFVGQAPDPAIFSADELETFGKMAGTADVILSLKEQPLRLARQAQDIGKPIIACLHRSDPEGQGSALNDLRAGVALGKIVACTVSAYSAQEAYVAAGIPEDRLHVIPNAVDLERFRPSPKKRAAIRQELDIPPDAPTVLYAARFDQMMKDVPLFLASAKKYMERETEAHIIMCGAGMNTDNEAMQRLLQTTLGNKPTLRNRMHLLGIQHQMENFYAASDIVSCTSAFGESAPLVLLEGMAAGAVPVATDVGDTRRMLDGHGIITPRDPARIADAWQRAYDLKKEFALSPNTRQQLGRDTMITAYAEIVSRYAQ